MHTAEAIETEIPKVEASVKEGNRLFETTNTLLRDVNRNIITNVVGVAGSAGIDWQRAVLDKYNAGVNEMSMSTAAMGAEIPKVEASVKEGNRLIEATNTLLRFQNRNLYTNVVGVAG